MKKANTLLNSWSDEIYGSVLRGQIPIVEALMNVKTIPPIPVPRTIALMYFGGRPPANEKIEDWFIPEIRL